VPHLSPATIRLRPLLTIVVVVLLGAAGAGCSGGDADATGRTDVTSPGASTTMVDATISSCADVEPGVVVDAPLAVVRFDPEKVCPGWVTVERGTTVTFANDDVVERTVVVTADQLPDSVEIARIVVPPGAIGSLETPDLARMGFSTDALPGFRGTVEVVDPGGATHH
jgi:plastocyanin